MNMSVSCSLMGEGPGTGGSGVAGGAERGGLMNARLGHRLNFPGVVYPPVGHSFVLSEISKQPESQSLIESRKNTYRAREY